MNISYILKCLNLLRNHKRLISIGGDEYSMRQVIKFSVPDNESIEIEFEGKIFRILINIPFHMTKLSSLVKCRTCWVQIPFSSFTLYLF